MKKRIIWISVAVVVLIAAVVACWWFLSGKDGGDGEGTRTEESSQKETASPAELMKMPALEGDTELSEERQELINQSILEQIDLRVYGRPSINEDGNYVALENGELYRKETESVDYANYNANISVLINSFADRGYSEVAINQIQRMYFHYWRAYSVYSTEELVEKLAQCFPAGGTNSATLTKKAYEVFGHVRDDGFSFVFEDVSVGSLKVSCYQVDPYFVADFNADLEANCLFDELAEDPKGDYERNLEKWLHLILYSVNRSGYGVTEMRIAQLLYVGSLCSSEYHANQIELILESMKAYSAGGTEKLATSLKQNFEVDLSENLLLIAYLDGELTFD